MNNNEDPSGLKRGFATSLALLLVSVFTSDDVLAAEQPSAEGQIEEITVTAEKRSESLQSVPMSITALTSAVLEQHAIVDFFDYATQVPNLGFAYTGDGIGTARTVSIRGISGDNVTSIYLDETPLPDSIDPRILDVDHIEVLRGPQGTLYGARSMAGVVRLITMQPNLESQSGIVHGGVSHTWHTDEPNRTVDVALNIPLATDRAALRITGFYDVEAGYLWRRYCTNPATAGVTCFPPTTDPSLTTTVKNQGATRNYGGSLTLTVKANDALTITPRVLYQKSIYDGFPLVDVSLGGGPAGFPVPPVAGPQPPLTPSNFVQGRFFNSQEGGFDQWSLSTLTIKYETPLGHLISSTSYFSRDVIESENMSEWVWQYLLAPGLPLPGLMREQKKYDNFVQELRFASEFSGPWQFVSGGYFSNFHGQLPFASYYPNADMPGFAAEFNNPSLVDSSDPDNIFGQDYDTSIREAALFGETSYALSQRLKATVGMRLYQIETTAGGYLRGVVTGGGAPLVDPTLTVKAHGVNPKGEIAYQITPANMVYGLIAKGYRPGGLVPSVPVTGADSCAPVLNEIGITAQQARVFRPDSLWNYEIGAKTGWLDNTLTVNGSVFYIRWNDIQQWIPLPCGFQYRANAGAAVSKGFEVEIHSRPVQGLDLSVGVGYNDARITATGASSPQQVGDRVLQVPDWTANAAATYSVPLGTLRSLVSTVNYGYVGTRTSANNDPFAPRLEPSYGIVDARIAYQWDKLELALVGKNLTNTHANLSDNRSITAEVTGRPRLVTNQPQTIGLEFRLKY